MATDASATDVLPADRSLLLNALIGAVVAVVLSFVPFSPVLGGAVAGYLQGDRGPRVGGLSGLLAAIPVAVFAVAATLFLSFVLAVGPGAARTLLFFLVFLFVAVLVVAAVYVVLGAVGGVLGVAIHDREAGRDTDREAGRGTDRDVERDAARPGGTVAGEREEEPRPDDGD